MNSKQELLALLRQVISEHLGVEQEEITEKSAWAQLGADSLDRLDMSLAIENAFNVEIPHHVGERLNTVGETADHLWSLMTLQKGILTIQIEAATTKQQWDEISRIRNQVFDVEYGFSVAPLPGPGETGFWHILARYNRDAVGALSVVDTTSDREIHQRYHLSFSENDRVARYAQLAVLQPYRKCGIFRMLIEAAQSEVIHPNGFTIGWLLYPATRAHSSVLTQALSFAVNAPVLMTEFGKCHVLTRRETNVVSPARQPASKFWHSPAQRRFIAVR